MLMQIKNKFMLSIDKLIKDTESKNGVPSTIIFKPFEAASFLRELKEVEPLYRKHINVKHFVSENINVDIRFLLQPELTNERLQELINKWYKKEFMILYKDVELRVVGNEMIESNVNKKYSMVDKIKNSFFNFSKSFSKMNWF